MELKFYVLLTAARNEENYLEETINSVLRQTVLPQRWVIVSDGSLDRTDEIIKEYESIYKFIKFVRTKGSIKRNFASKVNAINEGFKALTGFSYDYIGILDADITLPETYYESLIHEFERNQRLGIAGGVVSELCSNKLFKNDSVTDSVRGAVQFFKRDCFVQIGGLKPLVYGGEDIIAEACARMNEWQIQAFSHLETIHRRGMDLKGIRIWKTRFFEGKKDYLLGNYIFPNMIRLTKKIAVKPFFLGYLIRIAGFLYASLKMEKRELNSNLLKFIRKENRSRLNKNIQRKSYH